MYEQLNVEKVLNVVERMKGLVAELETELSSSTVEETTATVAETEIIEHEGLKLKRVDRKAREGDYIRFINLNKQFTTDNKLYKVFMVNGTARYRNDSQDILRVYGWDITKPKIEVFEVVKESNIVTYDGLKLRKVNRVGRESDYVKIIKPWDSDLKTGGFYKIERVDGELGIKDDDGFFWEGDHEDFEFVETYEVIDVQAEKLPFPSIELTANQKRAKLIEKAKKFVEEHAVTSHIVEFIVNRKKRTVVVLIKEYETGKVVARGIAKCAPGDVFNQWIGKAIALARAIEIGVPNEFFEAVQPNKIVVGMIIEYKDGRIAEVINDNYVGGIDADAQTYLSTAREYEYHARIIDDTNAKYDEVI